MPRISLFRNMNRDQAINQFFFEHYVQKYIQVIKDHGWSLQEEELRCYRFILEGLSLVTLSVQPSRANKLRAELLLISNCVVQIQQLNEEGSLDDLSEDTLVDVCHDIQTLGKAVENIIQYVPSFKFRAIRDKCLYEINSLWEQATSQSGGDLSLPSFNKLWSLLRELLGQASQFIENPSQCSCQLLRKMSGEQVGERRCRLSHLQEIMGKAPEESDDEEEIRALQEKCRRRKKRQLSVESSDVQATPQGVRQVENGSLISLPMTLSVSAQEQAVREKTRTVNSSPDLEENSSGNQECTEDGTSKRKYQTLPDVKPRYSLLSFRRKPPSHSKGKIGKWLPNEEEEFILKTIQIGEGKWAEIRCEMNSARSSVQLKDKWRQISLSRVEKVARQYGLKYKGSKK